MSTAASKERAIQALKELGLPAACLTQHRLPLQTECTDLVSIGHDMFDREQRLERRTTAQWLAMRLAAEQDGIMLAVISAFRSVEYQQQIIARKLAAGISIEQIMTVSALPGFSEHHTGRVIDIGTPGFPPLTEAFEQTPAFDWLTRRAHEFGFQMSYPRENPFGIIYEPWHWCFRAI